MHLRPIPLRSIGAGDAERCASVNIKIASKGAIMKTIKIMYRIGILLLLIFCIASCSQHPWD